MDFLLSKIINRPKTNNQNNNNNNNNNNHIDDVNIVNVPNISINNYNINNKISNDVCIENLDKIHIEPSSPIKAQQQQQQQILQNDEILLNTKIDLKEQQNQKNNLDSNILEYSGVENCNHPKIQEITNNIQLNQCVDAQLKGKEDNLDEIKSSDLTEINYKSHLLEHLDISNNHSSDEESFAECNSYIDTDIENINHTKKESINKENVQNNNVKDQISNKKTDDDDLSYMTIKLPDYQNENISDIEFDVIGADDQIQTLHNICEVVANSIADEIENIDSEISDKMKQTHAAALPEIISEDTLNVTKDILNQTIELSSLTDESYDVGFNVTENQLNLTQKLSETYNNDHLLNETIEILSENNKNMNTSEIVTLNDTQIIIIKTDDKENILNNNSVEQLASTSASFIVNECDLNKTEIMKEKIVKEEDDLLNKTTELNILNTTTVVELETSNSNCVDIQECNLNKTEVIKESAAIDEVDINKNEFESVENSSTSTKTNLFNQTFEQVTDKNLEDTTVDIPVGDLDNNNLLVEEEPILNYLDEEHMDEDNVIREQNALELIVPNVDFPDEEHKETGEQFNKITDVTMTTMPLLSNTNTPLHLINETSPVCENTTLNNIDDQQFVTNIFSSESYVIESQPSTLSSSSSSSTATVIVSEHEQHNLNDTIMSECEPMDGIEFTDELKDIRIRSDIYNGNTSNCFSPNSIINKKNLPPSPPLLHTKLVQKDSGIFMENIIQDNFNVTFKTPSIPPPLPSSNHHHYQQQQHNSNNNNNIKINDIKELNANQVVRVEEEEEFKSSAGMIFESADFDYLSARGNNNIEIERNSILLRFDPLLGHAVPIGQLQQHQQSQSFLTDNYRLSPTTEELEFNEINQTIYINNNNSNNNTIIQEEQFQPHIIQVENYTTTTTDSKNNSIETENQENLDSSLNSTVLIKDLSFGDNHINQQQQPEELQDNTNIQETKFDTQGNATMSLDVLKDMKIENDIKSLDLINAQVDVKKEFKMAELEKKMKNEVLKTEDIEKKLKDAETREETLVKRITDKDKTITKMNSVMEAYEKAIAELIAEKEQIIQNYEKKCTDLKTESDLNGQHLLSLEATFSDLHVKYERSKHITTTLKQNEDILLAERKQNGECLKSQEQRYEKMKCHAMTQLEIANDKLEKLSKSHTQEITKLKAILKKEELSRSSVSEQLSQKIRENEELVKICDELINGGSS